LNTTAAQQTPVIKTSGIETLNITAGKNSSGTEVVLDGNSLDLSSSDATTVTVTASSFGASKTVALGTLNKATTTIDASGVKGATFTATVNSSITSVATVKGGQDANVLSATNATKAVTFNIGSGFDGSDAIVGGSGNDVLNATFSASADIANSTDGTHGFTGIETINYTVANGMTADYKNADDLAANTVSTVTVTGGNSNSTFKVTDVTLTLAFAGTGFKSFDASTFNGTTDIVADDNVLTSSSMNLKAGSGTSDALRIAVDTTTYSPGTVSGFENLILSPGTGTASLNLSSFSGVSNVYVDGAEGLALTNVAAGTTINLGSTAASNGYSSDVDFADGKSLSVALADASGTADSLTIKLNDVSGSTTGNTITTNGVENLTLSASTTNSSDDYKLSFSNSATTDQSIAFTGGYAGKSIIVAASGLNSYVKTVDASTLVADLNMDTASRSGTQAMTITGGSGNDTVVMKNISDVLDGGSNGATSATNPGDKLVPSFTLVSGGMIVDLSSTTDQITAVGINPNGAIQKGFESIDLTNVSGGGAEVTAASAGSWITGTSKTDVITGGAGNDSISSSADNDVINNGAGADTIDGGTGNDTINSGAGTDKITAGGGTDTIYLGSAASTYTDGVTDTVIFAATSFAAMTLEGGDTIYGFEDGTDVIQFASNLLRADGDITVNDAGAAVQNLASGADFVGSVSNASSAAIIQITGTNDLAGMNAASAANVSAFLTGTVDSDMTVVFAIDNGTDTYLWLFDGTSTNAATVDTSELTLVGVISGVNSLSTGGADFSIV